MTIGERIEGLLTEHGVYKEWLARESKKSLSTINRWLSGKKLTFKEREAQIVSQAFGMTLESFLAGVEGMEKPAAEKKAGRSLLHYPSVLTVERFSGKIVEDELDPAGNQGEVRTLEIIPFQTTPSKVYFQEICSMQVAQDSEWRGVRIAIERPCYREEEAATVVQVIRDVKRIMETERATMVLETRKSLYGSAQEMREAQ